MEVNWEVMDVEEEDAWRRYGGEKRSVNGGGRNNVFIFWVGLGWVGLLRMKWERKMKMWDIIG